ncbi:MAG TPA: NUDIX hydrolase [Candidatus Saccharimonadales bacterium]|nr:NUDIX hydrolase [Candidatus Saccharimonadales bacterium]
MKKKAHGPRTIVSCLIFNDAGKLLLLQRHRLAGGGGYWAPPGGKVEEGESLRAAVTREVQEETGLHVTNLDFAAAHEVIIPSGVVHMQSFVAHLSVVQEIVLDPNEHEAYVWLSLPELLQTERIIWGLPTILHDTGFIEKLERDHSLEEGMTANFMTSLPVNV